MDENTIQSLRLWEALKSRAEAMNLDLLIDQLIIAVVNRETEGVYFQAKNLKEAEIFINGYECGERSVTENN